jgi:hypothetical protein
MAGSFFRGDGVLRKILGQPSDNGLLGALIRLRDQINVALVRNLRRVIEFFAQNFACFLGGFYGGFEIVFIHGKMMQPGACSVYDSAPRRAHHSTTSAGAKVVSRPERSPKPLFFAAISSHPS